MARPYYYAITMLVKDDDGVIKEKVWYIFHEAFPAIEKYGQLKEMGFAHALKMWAMNRDGEVDFEHTMGKKEMIARGMKAPKYVVWLDGSDETYRFDRAKRAHEFVASLKEKHKGAKVTLQRRTKSAYHNEVILSTWDEGKGGWVK